EKSSEGKRRQRRGPAASSVCNHGYNFVFGTTSRCRCVEEDAAEEKLLRHGPVENHHCKLRGGGICLAKRVSRQCSDWRNKNQSRLVLSAGKEEATAL
ncbi:unnamed protein product, partial [Amoebophrya sp. A120]